MEKKLMALFVVLVVFISGCAVKPPIGGKDSSTLKKFTSLSDLKDFLKTNSQTYGSGYGFGSTLLEKDSITSAPASATPPSVDFSRTNVQVEGVDEPDIVKSDGKYIYTITGNRIVIIEAYPAENAKNISIIEFNGTVENIFINGDNFVAFGTAAYEQPKEDYPEEIAGLLPIRPYIQKSFVRIYDVSDRANPKLKNDLYFNGNYFDARMIGNWVYFIVNNNAYGDNVILPLQATKEIYYFDTPAYSYMLTLVGALNLGNGEVSSKTFLFSYTAAMFASLDNIFIAHEQYQTQEEIYKDIIISGLAPLLPLDTGSQITEIISSKESFSEKHVKIADILNKYIGSLKEGQLQDLGSKLKEKMAGLEKNRLKTVVYKISIKDGQIDFKGTGTVHGRLLNQFSMDEYNRYFRIATTTGNVWDKTSANHVYILDETMKVIGMAEGIAPGEEIYSARFLGDRLYLVTFKKVDPLFVIDLKDPTNPKILGKLKIPGFSDYLHPYDQNHIIGIGKETVEAEQDAQGNSNFAWYQGVKLALFDVSDPENPKEISKYIIGNRGTDSYALQDHKAFLFSKEKGLLVIPVMVAEINQSNYPEGVSASTYGEYTFQGAYVFNLTLDKGFELKNRVTHVTNNQTFAKGRYYYSGQGDLVKRSLYISNVLYTISDKFVKANNLLDLTEISTVTLPYTEPAYEYRGLEG